MVYTYTTVTVTVKTDHCLFCKTHFYTQEEETNKRSSVAQVLQIYINKQTRFTILTSTLK